MCRILFLSGWGGPGNRRYFVLFCFVFFFVFPEPNIQKAFRECLSSECIHHVRIHWSLNHGVQKNPLGSCQKGMPIPGQDPSPDPLNPNLSGMSFQSGLHIKIYSIQALAPEALMPLFWGEPKHQYFFYNLLR